MRGHAAWPERLVQTMPVQALDRLIGEDKHAGLFEHAGQPAAQPVERTMADQNVIAAVSEIDDHGFNRRGGEVHFGVQVCKAL